MGDNREPDAEVAYSLTYLPAYPERGEA